MTIIVSVLYFAETKSSSSYQEHHKENFGQVARLAEKRDQNLKGMPFVPVIDFISKKK